MQNLIVIGLCTIFICTILVVTFQASLPSWCANPNGNGNWIIQPMCEVTE